MVHPNYRDKGHIREGLKTKQKIIEYLINHHDWNSIKKIKQGTISKHSPKGISLRIIRKHIPELVKEKSVEYKKGLGLRSTVWIRLNTERCYGEPEEIRRLKKKMVDGLKNNEFISGDDPIYCFFPAENAIKIIDTEIKESLCKILSKGLKKYPTTKSNNLTFAFSVNVKEFKKYMKAKERIRQINATEKPSS